MSSRGSVTSCIQGLKAGKEVACQKVWERYFARLVQLARRKLGGMARRVADEEDVALSVLNNLLCGAREGGFPLLADRNDLWRLLVVLTARKSSNQRKYEQRIKRGGGKVRGESAFEGNGSTDGEEGIERVIHEKPDPATLVELAEKYEALLESLRDDRLRQIAIWSMEGHTHQEIAKMLDCSLRTVARKLDLIRTIWRRRRP
jgi:DNA-directed RNA polymerase specialized sigma24 family protein